jgi:hypothetical protein
MSFVKFLEGIGDRLGILEAVTAADKGQPARIQTRSISLRELSIEIKAVEVWILADSPAELTVPFEKIFETAGISSDPKEWTIDRLKQVIAGEAFKSKPRDEVQHSILAMLKAESVPVENIVKDAMARDKALDSFEAFARQKMQARMETRNKRLLEAEARIRELQKESVELEKALKIDQEKWKEWRKLKREKEHDLASTVGYIVNHPVITLSDEDEK